MPLITNTDTFLTGKEAAKELGITYQTFANRRCEFRDKFIPGHALLPGRVFFRVEDVQRIALERAK